MNYKVSLIWKVLPLFLFSSFHCVSAAPQFNHVAAGTASVTQTADVTQIKQFSQQAILEWRSFNIAAHETAAFVQPPGGIALNRIDPMQGASKIFGRLTATGKIILINGAGIYFGPTSHVDVGGLIASTSNISNENFLAGNYLFDQPTNRDGIIVNQGSINAADYGLVALLGNRIENHGIIQANLGQIILSTGSQFTLDFNGDQLIHFTVDKAALRDGRIINSGIISADGGKILLSAQAVGNCLDKVINMQGVAMARSVQQSNGEIILTADNGEVAVSGKLSASGTEPNRTGGVIKLLAKEINFDSGAVVDVNGNDGGGVITIADPHNAKASMIDLDGNAFLEAKASNDYGTGGLITLFAEKLKIHGSINGSASGVGGIGGQVSLLGERIDLDNASVTANGDLGGGIIRIGNKATFADSLSSSASITSDKHNKITAFAVGEDGTGGLITIFGEKTNINGLVSVSGTGLNGIGGEINVLGKKITIDSYASLEARGDIEGGIILVGGNAHGAGSQPNALLTTVEKGSVINASAITNGKGGKVVIWGDDTTKFKGSILATGGALSGDGGFVQVAGKLLLKNFGFINVTAPNGNIGTVLLTP